MQVILLKAHTQFEVRVLNNTEIDFVTTQTRYNKAVGKLKPHDL